MVRKKDTAISEKEKKIPNGMADAYAVPDDELENVTGGVPLSAWTALYGAEAARKQQEEDKEKDKRSARDFREKAFGAVRNANGN